MSQLQTQMFSYAYAGAGILAVILHPGLLAFLDFSMPGLSGALASVLTWAFLVGGLAGALGTARQRWWGFVGLYVATLAASFGLAICMVPFVVTAFPIESRTVPLLALNAVFLMGLVLLHRTVYRRGQVAAARGGAGGR